MPPGSKSINNAGLIGNNINPVTYQGMRVEALYKFNDDWNALITQSYQDMDSQGVFYQQPYGSDGAALQPLQVTLFNPSYDKDRFESTAWTLNGKFGDLKAVYTGGYLVRNVEQVGDYTNYSRGVYADYYQCYGPSSYTPNLASKCFSPSAYWRSDERNAHQQHEIRLSTPDDWRLRGIIGASGKRTCCTIRPAGTTRPCPRAPRTSRTRAASRTSAPSRAHRCRIPGIQSDDTSFYQDPVRETKQLAFFASADFDLIPKVLTLTAGTRYFRFTTTPPAVCFPVSAASKPACRPPAATIRVLLQPQPRRTAPRTIRSPVSRAAATSPGTSRPDTMVYYTFSQGFRPGGFNQNGGSAHAPTPGPRAAVLHPGSYSSDKLPNNEIGWKTEFFDHRLQWNGAIYRENWNDVQVAFFDPGVVGNIFFNTNGQDFLVKGLETSLVARVMPGLTVQAAGPWNNSQQTNSPILLNNNPASPGYGKPITVACNSFGANCVSVQNPFGPIDSPSANSPPLQFSVRARYEWAVGDYHPFVQAGATHQGHSFTQAGANPTIGPGAISTGRLRFENPAYSTYTASTGISKDKWWASLYCENCSNSNASTFISTDQFIVAQTPLRPRVFGGSFGYSF